MNKPAPGPALDHSAETLTIAHARGRAEMVRQSLSIAVALVPFGIAFGVACVDAGLTVAEAVGFSALVFSGSAQFAAVGVLGDGGTPAAAVAAGTMLNLRSLAFGVAMAPALAGRLHWRVAASHLMIDEATAVGSARTRLADQRFGYLAGGLAVFVFWNLSTVLGAAVIGDAEGFITASGADATIPAAFLALLWPRLDRRAWVLVAICGAGIALATAPILPPGLPILASTVAVLLVRPWATGASDEIDAGTVAK